LINPAGAFLDLEELLQRKFGLQQVLIAESSVEPSALVASSGDAYSSREKFPAILGALRGGWINIVNYRPIYGEAPGYGLSGIVFGLPQQSNCRFDLY
jgi:DNA-binding transcriptional regulator LsrR (DeoR family)